MSDLFGQAKLDWLDECRAEARKLLTYRDEITIEDVLDKCPRPKYLHPNTTGNVFKHPDFKKTRVGYSRRAVSHGRLIYYWTLVELPNTMKQINRMRLAGVEE